MSGPPPSVPKQLPTDERLAIMVLLATLIFVIILVIYECYKISKRDRLYNSDSSSDDEDLHKLHM